MIRLRPVMRLIPVLRRGDNECPPRAGGVAWILRRMAPRGSRGVPASIERSATSMQDIVRVGLIGSGFITSIHYEALRACARAPRSSPWPRPTPGRAERFAAERGIPHHFTDYRALARPPGSRPRRAGPPQ